MHRFCIFCGILASESPALAHPISLTEAVVDVEPNRVDVELKVLVEDLVLYYPLSADERDVYPAAALRKAAESHRNFVLDGLNLLTEKGTELEGHASCTVDTSQAFLARGFRRLRSNRFLSLIGFVIRLPRPLEFLTVSQTFGGAEGDPACNDGLPGQTARSRPGCSAPDSQRADADDEV